MAEPRHGLRHFEGKVYVRRNVIMHRGRRWNGRIPPGPPHPHEDLPSIVGRTKHSNGLGSSPRQYMHHLDHNIP